MAKSTKKLTWIKELVPVFNLILKLIELLKGWII